MLCVNTYTQAYIDECRARISAQLSAYEDLITAATAYVKADGAALDAAIGSFEPLFFNNMLLVMDSYFVHRSRTLELKDGNPLNEVRVLVSSLMQNHGIVTSDKTIKYDPSTSVLKYKIGEAIRFTERDFLLIFAAFFTEIEAKYLRQAAA